MAATLNGQNVTKDELSTDMGSDDETSSSDDEWDNVERDMIAKHGEWEEEADRHERAWDITVIPELSSRLPLKEDNEMSYEQCKKEIKKTFDTQRNQAVQTEEVDELTIKVQRIRGK